MKETIIKALAVILCVWIFSSSLSAGIGKFAEAEKTIADYEAQIAENSNSSSSGLSGGLSGMLGGSSGSNGSTNSVPNGGSTSNEPGDVNGGATNEVPNNSGNANGGATGEQQQPAQLTKADVIKFFNEETAKAAKGSYKLNRSGEFVKAIDVGNATDALNKIIKGVDKNADLNSVVGGFIGVKKDPITGTVANGKGEGFDAKYMIKAMNLTEADVIDFAVNGNKYAIQIANCKTPNASSPIAHATNDYITFAEVNKGISDSVGNAVKVVEGESSANYTKIIFIATVVDGKITEMEYSYTLNAKLKIQLAFIGATGTGEANMKGKYTNIKY